MNRINVAIFLSGHGSNAKNLINRVERYPLINIALIICDNSKSSFLKECFQKNISIKVLEKSKGESKFNFERRILLETSKFDIDWIFLAGFMKILSSDFIRKFYSDKLKESRIINIHPSLLPRHKGLDGFVKSYHSGDQFCGVSLHHVNEGIDCGKVFLQQKIEKQSVKDINEFINLGKKVEHSLFPLAFDYVLQKDKYAKAIC